MNKETFKNSPLAMKYVGVVRILLWPFGAWPGEVLGEKFPIYLRVHRVLTPVIAGATLLGQLLYVRRHAGALSTFMIVNCYLTSLCNALVMIRSILTNFKQYGNMAKIFLESFHLMCHRQRGKNFDKMCASVDAVSHYFSLYMGAMAIVASLLFNASSAYTNYKNGVFTGKITENTTLDLSVYIAFPGCEPEDIFYVAFLYNFYCAFFTGMFFCAIDLWLSLMVFQIIGHIKVLRQNLQDFPKPKKQTIVEFSTEAGHLAMVGVRSYDAEENAQVHKKLVDCILHHRQIVSFTEMMSDFFGPSLAINYGFHMLTCCVLLLVCTTSDIDVLLRFVPLTINVFGQLIQVSIIFEIILTESEKLPDAVYGMPWEDMDTSNRRTVCIMLHRVQTPIYVRAMGMTTVGVTTMAKILKTTFSYYAFLRTLNK